MSHWNTFRVTNTAKYVRMPTMITMGAASGRMQAKNSVARPVITAQMMASLPKNFFSGSVIATLF